MFDIPFELFALFMGLALVFVPIGLVTRKQGIGYMIMFTTGLFIAIMALTTDNIIMNTFASLASDNILHYDVQSDTFSTFVNAVGLIPVKGEYLSTSSSMLTGDTIDCIQLAYRRLGNPSVIEPIIVGIYNGNTGALIKEFGRFTMPTLINTGQTYVLTHCLPIGETFTLSVNHIVGVQFNAGDATNSLELRADANNPFDGTITFIRQCNLLLSTCSNTSLTQDVRGIFYLRGADITTIDNPYPFTEMPKTLFVMLGGFILFAGSMLLVKDN